MHPHLKWLRHVIQDEPDPNFALSPAFKQDIRALLGGELTWDLLVRQNQLPQTIRFVAMHPNQVFVLDHSGKPRIGAAPSTEWVKSMQELAAMPHVSCKLSGLVTEANWSNWSLSTLQPYLDVALDLFGAERLMAGSDWPVCLVASTYNNGGRQCAHGPLNCLLTSERKSSARQRKRPTVFAETDASCLRFLWTTLLR